MSNFSGNELVRPEILNLKSYRAAEQRADTIRLNANEAPVATGSADSQQGLNRYPDVRPFTLQAALADLFEVKAANLVATRGSSEAIDALVRAYCRAYQDSLITTPPTFEMYRFYADVQGVDVIEVPLNADSDFTLDPDAVVSNCREYTKLVFLCSPNNPTGTQLPRGDILDIAHRLQGRAIVVVDEAYIEFAASESMIDSVDAVPNLVVLRTLSKAHALAGARCGVAIANPVIVETIGRVLPPYSFPTPVIDAVLAKLSKDQLQQSNASLTATIAERDRVSAALDNLPSVAKVWPSEANFILARFYDLDSVQQSLQENRILIRTFGNREPAEGLHDCARITIGSAHENDALLNALSTHAREN